MKCACWVQGVSSKDFVNELGYLGCEEIVHRDNICLLQRPHSNLSEANLKESGNSQSSRDQPNGLTSEEGGQHGSSDAGEKEMQSTSLLQDPWLLCQRKCCS